MFSAVRITPIARPTLRLPSRPFLRSLTASTPPPQASQTQPDTHHSISPTASSRSYFVQRTPSQQLPVYQSAKGGGSKLLTKVQKVSGRVEDLKRDLQVALSLNKDQIIINPVNRHIVIKGWVKKDVAAFLLKQNF